MRITIIAFGTRGDVQPAVALGKALKAEGHSVRILAGANFKSWIERHGLEGLGANLFAACPDAKRLERLDLSYNGVTATGLAALRAAGVNAVANHPLTQAELDSREYLRQGDFE